MPSRWLVFALGTIVGCDAAAVPADLGRDALLQIPSAQFRREPMPEGDGPQVTSATVSGRTTANVVDGACSGDLERGAVAVAIGIPSDVGYWIVRAEPPLLSAPTSPTFQTTFGLAARLPAGATSLVFRGVDAEGVFGPARVRPLEIAPTVAPQGRLVISLAWKNQADLDLHVVLPTGVEIFKRRRTEYERPPPSAGPVDPNAPTDGGFLDRDSNANCVLDGKRAENVIWTEAPPPGRYTVRVDTFSLCGASVAPWTLEARLDGVRIGSAQGTSTDNDQRFGHDRGAGLLALSLDVPPR